MNKDVVSVQKVPEKAHEIIVVSSVPVLILLWEILQTLAWMKNKVNREKEGGGEVDNGATTSFVFDLLALMGILFSLPLFSKKPVFGWYPIYLIPFAFPALLLGIKSAFKPKEKKKEYKKLWMAYVGLVIGTIGATVTIFLILGIILLFFFTFFVW